MLLHIGLAKCGSSFLQELIFPNCLGSYIKPGIPAKTREIEQIINGIQTRALSILDGQNRLKEILQAYSSDNLIISSEDMIGGQFNCFSTVRQIFNVLDQLFERPKYLIIIRRQDKMLRSMWFEGAHRTGWFEGRYQGKMSDFNDYVGDEKTDIEQFFEVKRGNGPASRLITSYKCYNYLEVLSPYLNIPERAVILPLELLESDPRQFFQRLTRDYGVSEDQLVEFVSNSVNKIQPRSIETIYLFTLSRYLPTFNALVLRVLYKVYLTSSNNQKDFKFFNNPLAMMYLKSFGKAFFLMMNVSERQLKDAIPNKSKMDQILDYHKESNQALEILIDVDLKQYGYY